MTNLHVCLPVEAPSTRGVAPTRAIWTDRNVLSVGFLNGDRRLHSLVMAVVGRFTTVCNMRLVKIDGAQDAVIRVTFNSGGSYSFVGTDNLFIPKANETMNFGWLEPDMSPTDNVARAVILHEFGHALGMVHEHSHPRNDIPWNRPAVHQYYGGLGWSRAEVDHNIFARFGEDETQFNEYDRESIMHYHVPNEHTHGDFSVPWRHELSKTDGEFLGGLYPYGHTVHLPIMMA